MPLELVQPEALRLKAFEPILVLGKERFANLDMRIHVSGGGQTSQIYGMMMSPGGVPSPYRSSPANSLLDARV